MTIQQGDEGKGRVFQAAVLACVQAQCWEGAGGNNIRPVYLMIGASEGEAGPVLANLRMGKKASVEGIEAGIRDKKEIELLKSAGYEFAQQRHRAGVVIQVYLPELFRLDPGIVDPERVRFVLLPRRVDIADPALDIDAAVRHMRALGQVAPDRERYDAWRDNRPTEAEIVEIVPYAALFGAYLNSRTRCPLVPDLRFLVQILTAFLHHGFARRGWRSGQTWGRPEYDYSASYREVGVTDVGLVPGLMVNALASEVETLLAAEIADYFKTIG